MAGFNRRQSGGRGDFRKRSFGDRGSRSGFGSRDRSEKREMYKAVCSNCGKDCEVPFRPTSGKPVFCSDCFETQGGVKDQRRPERKSFDRPRFGRNDSRERKMFDAVCDNCGNNCQIPFQPRNGKPVFCSNCFEKNESGEGSKKNQHTSDTYAKDFAALNAKLDKILSIIAPTVSDDHEAKEIVAKVTEELAVAAPEKKKRVSKKKVLESKTESVSSEA